MSHVTAVTVTLAWLAATPAVESAALDVAIARRLAAYPNLDYNNTKLVDMIIDKVKGEFKLAKREVMTQNENRLNLEIIASMKTTLKENEALQAKRAAEANAKRKR